MTTFDAALWESRALKRAGTALAKGKDAAVVVKSLQRDIEAIIALRVVVEWCDARKLTLHFVKREGAFFYPTLTKNEIKVSSRASPRQQLYLLLHECGHFLRPPIEKVGKFFMGYVKENDPKVKKSDIHRIDILDEEMDAWHRGWGLAVKLGALSEKDRTSFDKTRIRCLKTYVKWAARAEGFEHYE